MKKDIHPKYQPTKVICSCGASFEVGSTSENDITVEICSECHPFFTGQQKLVDTAGRLDKFKKRVAHFEKIQKSKDKSQKEESEVKKEKVVVTKEKKEKKPAKKATKAKKKEK